MRTHLFAAAGFVLALAVFATGTHLAAAAGGHRAHHATATPAWTCAGFRIDEYTCRTQGNSTVKWRLASAGGPTAAAAFRAMIGDATWVSSGIPDCLNGAPGWTPATLVNACARTR